jgi:ketosteroid isomerase-like protein
MRTIATLLLGALMGGVIRAPAAPTPDSTAEIREFEAALDKALAHNDVPALQRLLARDWSIVSADGNLISRDRFLAVIASGDLKHSVMSSDAPTIRVYGSTALVTAHAASTGSYKGVAFHTSEIGTDVLVRREGHWVCVLSQLTAVAAR